MNKQFVHWNNVSSVLVLAYDNHLSDIAEFVNTCTKSNKYVLVAFVFDGKPEQVPNPNFAHLSLDKKQFTFFHLPTEEVLQKLGSTVFDVMIHVGDDDQIKTLSLSQLVPAKCKISNFKNPIFDLTIESDKPLAVSDFLEQVVLYLNMIKN